MDTQSFPNDDRYSSWLNEHGSTGVKNYVLDAHPSNKGHVAVYREMSMGERQLLGRLEAMEEENPGVFDMQRMLVSTCLLYPSSVDEYPKPPFAVAELFNRVRQHGHGPLSQDEEMVTQNEDHGAVPRHTVEDIRQARDVAYDIFHDPQYGSVYRELVIELSSDHQGQIDPETLDYLWSLSPGRVRDIAARVEQVHANVRRQALQFLRKSSDLDGEEKQARAEQIRDNFASPWAAIDQVVGDEATPDPDEEEEEETKTETKSRSTNRDDSGGLPPNRPPSKKEVEDVEKTIQSIVDN